MCEGMAASSAAAIFMVYFAMVVFKLDQSGDRCSSAAPHNREGQQTVAQGGSGGCGSAN